MGEREPFFFKLNSRSAKDSSFYKEVSLFAAIAKTVSKPLVR
jgi:hypothetical protein